jgi:glycosyltransferase involved in cell wall biosynthesis
MESDLKDKNNSTFDMILQVLDSSHADWVQGGTFQDLRDASTFFEKSAMYLSPPPKNLSILAWGSKLMRISKKQDILFSSMTPAQNFFRVRDFMNHTGSLGLWFTHKDGSFSRKELSILQKMDLIFVHSSAAEELLRDLTPARIVRTVGGIDPVRFSRPAKRGKRIVWVGTPVSRKRPEVLIEMIQNYPEENFRIVGKNWDNSRYWSTVNLNTNVEYVELTGPLTSSHLDGCDVFLMTSRMEGGPMPLMESVAAGLSPVIATKTGFAEDILQICGLPEIYSGVNTSEIFSEISRVRTQMKAFHEDPRVRILEYSFNKQAGIIAGAFQDFILQESAVK